MDIYTYICLIFLCTYAEITNIFDFKKSIHVYLELLTDTFFELQWTIVLDTSI